MKRRHFTNFDIAGFTYWDGALAFQELSIGTELYFKREEDNKFDPYAVAIYYKDYKLGFIPRNMNKDISKFCEQGYADIFEVRINRIAPDENPEDQIGVIVYLKQASALSDDSELL